MNYIARNLEKVVLQVSDEYPVVLVTGPRQVGKTTMLQKLMEGTGRKYVSLDDLNERNIAKTDPELFLQDQRRAEVGSMKNRTNSYICDTEAATQSQNRTNSYI